MQLWAETKLEQNKDYEKYKQYEAVPSQAMLDLKELVDELASNNSTVSNNFRLFNRSTPCHAAATLIKFHKEDITPEDLEFCIDIIMSYAERIATHDYQYQIGDGLKSCFDVLPDIFRLDQDLQSDIKIILLVGLFRNDRVDMLGNNGFYAFPINAIHDLWADYQEDIESILKGYLLVSPNSVSYTHLTLPTIYSV